jgi:uroporphyrinogen III methyltransferase/synthase
MECLRRADLVLCDYLVNAAILRHAPPTAERISLGHHSRQWPQEEINARMVEAARAGKTVVRLKGGDPDVFGRSVEETEALRQAGIPFETVPGVTAALAAAGYVGIPITHAQYSSAVALVTGQERPGKQDSLLDYEALARFPGTLIFYMGVTSASRWTEGLVRGGKPPETPVAIVRRCSWNDQRTTHCTLKTTAAVIDQQKIRPPAVIVVGPVAALAPAATWFTARPLFGKRILVTRPRDQADELGQPLAELGAEVLYQPAIEIRPPADWGPVDAALNELDRYDWLVFSSANGVRWLLDRLCLTGDLRRLGGVRLAAIGSGTAEELARYRLRADLVPREFRAEALAAELAEQASGKRFLLARASRGREVLAEQLAAAGAAVEQVVVYQSVDVERPDPEIAATLTAGRIDWITVTSSAIARSLARMFGPHLEQVPVASISPVTSETLRGLGCEPAVEATEYTMHGLIRAILGKDC